MAETSHVGVPTQFVLINMHMYVRTYIRTYVYLLCRYDSSVYNEWGSGVDEVAKASLEKPLLLRDPVVMHLTVNFDPQVHMLTYVQS